MSEFETAVSEGVVRLQRPETRWLSSGWDGGFHEGPVAYNVTVPEGFDRTDLDRYASERRERAGAGFETPGPTLLTGVSMEHARVARTGSVVAVATVGLSNPAALPMEPSGEAETEERERPQTGTVNLLVATTRTLADGALANLLTVVAEAKAATLLSLTESGADVPGTTSDAVLVGTATDGERATFSGSATPVGAAARACVREAVRASFEARYTETDPPASVEEAAYGIVTDQRAEVSRP